MGNSVYAEGMGFFHKGSGGQGIAPGDVCLSPPPPPAGPVPVPYVNMLSASDLIKGSKSVKIQGNPTALESSSEIAMSTGNEPATPGLGAGVVTHKIKGKGTFKLWSFTVKVEGKGVDRHGDMMGQNEMSSPPNCIDAQALVDFKALLANLSKTPCPDYKRADHGPDPEPSPEQVKKVNGQPCWECKQSNPSLNKAIYDTKAVKDAAGNSVYVNNVLQVAEKPNPQPHYRTNEDGAGMTHDHQPPMNIAWKAGGCHLPPPPKAKPTGFQTHMSSKDAVKPHCRAHASSQGGTARGYANNMM
jgi:uncharacterized Zn-binding protein involved in type VI secretion